jgi:hypothetical protein
MKVRKNWRWIMARHNGGYTGRIYEEELLGRCFVRWGGYMSFQHSVRLVMENQPVGWNPERPRGVAGELHRAIADELYIRGQHGTLRLFSAVGTPLDRYHGADGFFVFRGKMVTLDVTINSCKDEGRADFVLQRAELEDGELRWKLGVEIAARLAA